MSETFPPTGPTTLGTIIPAYVFIQYADDDDIQAIFAAQNALAQQYATWFQNVGLPIYTGAYISGAFLDWVAAGIYGLTRPNVPQAISKMIGPIGTMVIGELPIAIDRWISAGGLSPASDDLFRRMMTWRLFKGDGKNFNIKWLKRRAQRYLAGLNGINFNIDQTYDISVEFNPALMMATITIPQSPVAAAFKFGVETGALEVPFQFRFRVDIEGAPELWVDGNGNLRLTSAAQAGWPTVSGAPYALYSNGNINGYAQCVISGGHIPSPTAPIVYFNATSAAALLTLGAANLPIVDPQIPGVVWNYGGSLVVSAGPTRPLELASGAGPLLLLGGSPFNLVGA